MLEPYPKINSLWKRDKKGKIDFDSPLPEFAYLWDNEWIWTEKVDGTNIRLGFEYNSFRGNEHAWIMGRTDNAQIPPKLLNALIELQQKTPYEDIFPDPHVEVTLYGEGYGAGIQKGGGNYRPDQAFVLFDVNISGHWLSRVNVIDVAIKLGLDYIPVVTVASIEQAIRLIKMDLLESQWSNVTAEGLVGRPNVDLYDRHGNRLTTKIKRKDFSNG